MHVKVEKKLRDCDHVLVNLADLYIFLTDNSSVCIGCPMGKSIHGRPNEKDFMKYLPWFLKDNPGLKCAKG